MAKKAQQVIPNGSRWSVRSTGALKVSNTFPTRAEAIAKARELARNNQTELYIFGADGRIHERHSYRHASQSAKP